MTDLSAWFRGQAARARRVIYLEDALLGRRFAAYAWYRLRFFLARYLLSSVLHTLQVILLFKFFSLRQFQGVLLVQAASALASGFWWGSLEAMRARVRTLQRDRQSHRLPQEIAQWLSLSLRLAAAVVLCLILGVLAALGVKGRSFGPADLYLAAVLLRLALNLVARTYHSGAYALRRVFRPLPSILAIELLGFGAVLAFWPWLRTWSLPLAFLVSTLAGQALLFRFTKRAYQQLGLPVWPWGGKNKQTRPILSSWREWLAAGTSYALMGLDSLLVLGLFRFGRGRAEAAGLALLFFLLAPTVRAGFEWAQLFYFDLKRLETPLHRNLKMRFDRNVLKLAACLGLGFWAAASGAYAVFSGRSWWVYALLLPFFMVRSWLAALQMKSYSEGRYRLLFLSGVVSLAGLVAIPWSGLAESARLGALILALALSVLVLILGRAGPFLRPLGRGLRCLPEWLAEAQQVRGSLAVSALDLDPGLGARQEKWRSGSDWVPFQFARRLAIRLDRQGAAAMAGPNRIVWFETAPRGSGAKSRRPRLDPYWLVANSAGWTESIRSTGLHPDGRSALGEAAARGFFGPELDTAAVLAMKPLTVEEVEREFRRWEPEGIVFDPARPAPASLRTLGPSERRGVLLEALSFVSGTRPFPIRTPFHVTAFAQEGGLRLIFLLDRKKPQALKAGWESLLRRLNLEAALRGFSVRSSS